MGVPYAEVIGDPIAHSKSPLIHKFWLGKLGLDYEFRACRVAPMDLPDHLERRRVDPLWCGSSVTIPHKQAVIPLLDGLTRPADAIGAVNAVTGMGGREPKLFGHNTDAHAFLDTLRGWTGLGQVYRMASVIGTGGGAAAVAWALREHGFLVMVYSRSEARGEAFLRRLGESDMDFVQRLEWLTNDSPGAKFYPDSGDIVVNASPLGMQGFPPLEINIDDYPPATIFYDLVYAPVETPLLQAARERGYPVISGVEMLIAQAARAFYLFFTTDAPREYDEELRELLTS
jgi:shikimate dehydrogenase